MHIASLTLAKNYKLGDDVRGWHASEKLDGVRALWDGACLRSRNDLVFNAPPEFLEGLPKGVMLDGELWAGRGTFQNTVGRIKSGAGKDNWAGIKYMVFDAPARAGTWVERMQYAKSFARGRVEALYHEPITDDAHLTRFVDYVIARGGEGAMLRHPTATGYEQKRTGNLLKVKRWRDLEAHVVAHEEGKGKHKGRLGALVCELDDGTRFNVGTGLSDVQRAAPPEVGAFVRVKFFELTNGGVPRFPVFDGEVFELNGKD